MRARWLAVASVALAWAIAGASAWAFPVEIYRSPDDPGLGATAAIFGVVLAPTFLLLALGDWDRRWLRWVFLLLGIAGPVSLVLALRSSGSRVVVAVSARALRVDLHQSGSPVRVGRERISAARVRCVVSQHESCDWEGENCSDFFRVDLMLGRRELAPSTTHGTIDMARGQCAQLAAYGIRMEEGR